MDTIKKFEKGLQKLTLDPRDYSHHDFFGTLGASDLPTHDFTIYDSFNYTVVRGDTLSAVCKKFNCSMASILAANPQITNPNKIYVGETITIPAITPKILNQLDLDFCTAFSASELQNAGFNTSVDPFYQFAKIKQIRGEYTQYGANVRDSAQSVVKYGSLNSLLAPFTHDTGAITDKTRDFLANWADYPIALDAQSARYKDLSFFALDGTYDAFDNIRSALWIHIQERRGVSFGMFWHDAWTEVSSGIIPDLMPNDALGGGHDVAIVGQKTINGELYLIVQNSWGETAGDKGFYYFPRTIIDLCFNEGFGAFIFSRTDASGLTSDTFMGAIAALFNKVVGIFKK